MREEAEMPAISVVSSVIFEDPCNGELTLNFYTSKLDSDEMEYYQAPLHQTFRIDYPLLAYKHMTPDNKEIVLMHLT